MALLCGFFEIAFLNIPLGALLLLAASVIDATSEQALHKSQRSPGIAWAKGYSGMRPSAWLERS
jgi:hypothetical protein